MNSLTMKHLENIDFLRKRSPKKSNYSVKGLKILMIFGLLLFSISVFGQNDGDFRSRNNGNWTDVNSWSVYDSSQPPGSEWVNATNYPGQNAGTYDVYIVSGNQITLNSNINNAFNSLTIGDNSLPDREQLIIDGTSFLDVNLFTIASDGEMDWTANKTFSLPVNTPLVIESGGDLIDDTPCDAAQRIQIGSVLISSCNGGANPEIGDFDDLVNVGGYVPADLSLEKTLVYGAFGSNEVTFTITVTNDGPNDATGVTVNDDLPNGYTYVSHSGGSYDDSTGIWNIGDLSNGNSTSLDITATINYAIGNNYENVAEIETSGNYDPDSTPGNGSTDEDDDDSVSISLVNLALSKSVNVTNQCVGEDVIFTLQVSNNFLLTASGVEVTDLLPNGYDYVSDNSGGDYNIGTGIWSVPNISGFSSQSIEITATVQSSGNYTNSASITASDGYDFTPDNNEANESVTVNPLPTAAIANNNGLALSCTVPSTTLTASGGVSYSWSDGSSVVGTSADLAVTTAGTFTVTVTGANGCTDTETVSTTLDNTPPTAAIANNNGLALSCTVPSTTLTASGGVSYSWSDGSSVVGTSADLAVTTAGTFTVTVTGANGCTDTETVSTTLDNTPPTAAIANNNGLALSCTVPSTTLTASGGVSYSWSDGSSVVGTSADLAVTTAGTFTVTVTGANGCTDTETVSTTLDNTPPTAAIANNNGLALSCTVPSTTLTASGGVSYSWSDGSSVVGTSADLAVTTAGTFTVTVTGANGCTDTETVSTTLDNTPPTAAIANNNGLALSCTVPSTTLTASGGVSYSWSDGSSVVGTSADLAVTTAGTFTVTVTGANGCTDTETVSTTLDNTPPTAAIANNNGLALSCTVPSTTLTASGGVSYSWSDGSSVVGTSADLAVTTAGTFTVTVTGANGCTDTETVSTTLDNTPPTAAIANNNGLALSCTVPSTTLTASGGVSYSWSDGSSVVGTSADLAVTTAGTFTVTVTGANGCTDTETVSTTLDNTPPTAAIANNNGLALSCTVPSTTLTASGGVSYSWSDGSSVVGTSADLAVTTAGTFTVTVTGANGCTDTETVSTTLDNTPPTAAIANNNGLALSCTVPSTTLTASGGVSYSWSDGSSVVGTSADLAVTTAGTFTVTVTGANGCTDTETVSTTLDNTPPTAAIANNNGLALSCTVPSTTLTASGGVSYSWSDGSSVVGTSADLAVTTAGTFTVTVTGANGCTDTETVSTTLDNTPPTAAIANNNGLALSCTVPSTTLTASGGVSYSWSDGSSVVGTSADLAVTTAGTFTVTVTGANGCTDTETVSTTLDNTPPTAAIANNNGLALSCTVPSTTLTASGGVSYSWSDGSSVVGTSADLAVTTAGTFTVTVTGANGCTDTETVSTTLDNTPPTVTVTPTATELTCDVTTITISATPTVQGTASYLWSTGATTASIDVSAIGTYSVVVTDSDNGCEVTSADVEITQDITAPTVTVTPTATELTCDVTTITISATPTVQGTASYLWSTGETTASIDVSAIGTYSVVVTDSDNGCEVTSSDVEITQDITAPTVTVTPTATELTCDVTTITISATPTVQGTASYLWSTGETTASIDVSAIGTYSVVVTDSDNGCEVTSSDVEITQDITAPTVTVTPDATELTCSDTSINIAAVATVQGTASYLWSTGATTASIDVTTAGTYSVVVTDSDNGCEVTSLDVEITQDTNIPTAEAGLTAELTCDVTTVTLDGSGTTTGLEYLWTGPGTITAETTLSPTVDAPGIYTLTVTNPSTGCVATDTVEITQDITAPTVTVTPTATELTCDLTTITISATPTVQGTASYLWSTGATTASIDVSAIGTYSVVVTDSDNGCEVTSADVEITQDITAPTVTVTPTATELTCDVTTITISATPTVQGTASYLWSTGETTASIDVSAIGTYSVVVTDSDNGCEVTSADVEITQDITPPTVTVTPTATELTCDVTTITISATPTVQGTASYLWSTGATTASIDVSAIGTYSVVVTDSDNGCEVTSADVEITQDITAPTVTVTPTATELTCDVTTITISATPTVQGTASYLWSTGETTASIDVSAIGTYSVVVTDSDNGCEVTSSDVEITQDITAPTVTVTPTATELTCDVTTITISATPTVQGTASYLWSTGETTASIDVSAIGTYSVVVTDSDNGCEVTSSDVEITQDITAPTVTVTPDATELTCSDTSINIAAVATVQGTASYLWSTGATTASIDVTTAGTYSVVVTDSDNGCEVTSLDVEITQDTNIPTAEAGLTAELTCDVTTVTLDGSGTTTGLEYLWTGPGTITAETTLSPTVDAPGIYTLTVTNPSTGCVATDTVEITQDITAPTVTVTPTATELTCDLTTITISATPTVQGTASYLWSTGATTASIDVSAIGTYSVVVTDSDNGCEVTSADVEITQDITAPTVTVTPTATELTCDVTTITISATPTVQGTASYLWSTGETTASIDVSAIGTYSVVVTDSDNGCEVTSADVEITQDITPPTVTVTPTATELTCDVTTITISATPTVQGTASYLWSTGATTASIDVSAIGTYSVVVTDSDNGCEVTSADVEITQDITAPTVTVTPTATELTCDVTTITISATPTVQGTASYLWSTGETTASIDVSAIGTYSVVVTDSDNGCEVTSSDVEITQDITAPTVTVTPTATELTCDVTTITISATPTVQGTASYLWSTGETTASIDVSAIGTYSVVVTDSDNGCEVTSSDVEITQDITAPTVTVTPDATELTCSDTSINIAAVATVQGTASYLWSTGATTASIDVTTAGTYSVVVTDSDNGCEVTSLDVEITQDTNIPTAEAGLTAELTCDVTTVTLDGSGTTTGLEYLWTGPGTITAETTLSPTVDAPGIYTLTVTNPSTGCVATDTVEITQDITAPTVTVTPTATELTCDVTTITISATPTVQGTASYLWSTGETTASIDVSAIGTYSVVVTDSDNGCEVTSADVEITQDITAPTVTVTPTATELTCDVTTITISATPTVQGTASYLWSTGETTASIDVSAIGTYSVVVTDSDNGCEVTSADVEITQDITPPTVTVTPTATELTCDVTTITISATPTVQGTASYLWSTGATTASIDVSAIGTYSVVVTDSDNGCEVTSADVEITQDITAPTVTVTPTATELTCDVTTITISATPTVQGTASYLWSTGETTASIDVSAIGTYSVVVTDSDNGCEVTSSDVEITQDITAPTVTVTPTATELTCDVTTITISATPTVQGTASYLWSTGETTASIDVSAIGTYSVVVTDSDNGCEVTSSDVEITQDITAPTVTVTPDATELTCSDTSINIAAVATVQGTASYLWSTGATTASIDVTTAGTYSVVVTDSDNGCEVTSLDVEITQDTNIPTAEAGLTAELTCDVTTVTLDGSGTTTGLEYLWTGPGTITAETTLSPTVDAPGIYTLTVTNPSTGCVATDTVEITQDITAPTVTVTPTATELTCDLTTITISATPTVQGTASYLWSTGATTASIDVSAIGTYSVVVTDSDNGCEVTSADVEITQDITAPTVTVTPTATELTCDVTTITISATPTVQGTASYLWSTGETTASIDVSAIGTYSVVVTDSDNGCEVTSADVEITQDITAPVAEAGSATELTCAITTITLDGSGSSGQGVLIYAWTTVDGVIESGAGTSSPEVSATGTYTLTVTDTDNGCTATDIVIVTEDLDAPIIDTVDPTDPTLIACPDLDNGSISITATGSNLEYSIDNGVNFQASNTFNNLDADTYEIVVRDNITGCSTAYGTPVVLTAPNCVADYTVSITQDSGPASVNAIGQTLGYTIEFTNTGTLDVTGINIVNTQPDGTLGTLVGPTGDAGTPGVLDIGETWTYTVSYTTSLVDFQNAIDLVNTISVTSAEVAIPEEDTAITPIIVSDLSLNVSVNNPSPTVGSDVILTIEVQNDGPSDVTGVQVTDLLPNGYTYVSDDAGTYDEVSGLWTIGGITNGASALINITATVNVSGDYTNVAEVTAADNLDPDSTVNNNDINEDDQDSISLTPEASSDISLTMEIDNDTPNVGDTVVFTLTVNNNGPSDAAGVEVTDLLPSGYTFVSDDASGNYNSTSGVWTIAQLGNGSSATMKITATVNVSGDYTNIGEVTASDNNDPNSTPNNGVPTEDDYASVTAVPNPISDIELNITVDNAVPLVGEDIIFTIDITNNGPSDATGVIVSDLLPSGYIYVSDDAAGNYNSNTGVWTVDPIAGSEMATINITASVNASGDFENVAEVIASDNLDPDSTPNNGDINEDDQASISITPVAVSDIELAIDVNNGSPYVGSDVVFTITVSNNGPSDVTGIQVSNLLPNGYTYVSDDAAGNYDSVSGLWIAGDILSGNSIELNITATVNVTGEYENAAEVIASDNFDPDSTPANGIASEDDQDSVSTTPQPVSDLSMNMTVDNATPYVGGEVVFTIEITNNGPSDATGIQVTDLLPGGYTYVSDDSGAYVDATGIWTVGDITNGNTSVINITASVNATGNYTNAAEVTASDNFDPNSTPNNGVRTEDDYFEITTNPIPVADLSLVKTVNDMNPTTGDIVTFAITVTNDGPSNATDIAVEDIVPDGFGNITLVTAGSSLAGSTISWNGLSVASGDQIVLEFSAEVLTTGTYVNQAEITASDVIDFDSEPSVSFDTDDYADGIEDDDESILDDMVINFLPTAIDDDVIIVENTTNNPIMVLIDNGNGADDFGGDGPGTVPVVLAGQPANGVASVNDNGTPTDPTDDYIMYTPNEDFIGFDSFTYTIEDGQGLIGSTNGDRSTATVNIEVLVDTDGDMVGDIYDIDDDNDGILDTVEGDNDSDSDGYIDSLDLDADNDGLPDNIEAQEAVGYIAPSGIDTDKNGLDDVYESAAGAGEGLSVFNNDGDSTPDYIDTDSDNDNVPDSLEGHDADHDSLPDAFLIGSDADEDGLDDGFEGADVNDGFVPNDEIVNLSILPDADGDASPDFRDEDDDNDGIATIDEDRNGDNDPTNDDTDGDMIRNYLDMDDDNDGILTVVEGTRDEDGDGFANYLDLDADDDGIPDNIEAQSTVGYVLPGLTDANNNGVDDAYEGSSGSVNGLTPVNTDTDSDEDYLDTDSDNDNVPDEIEAHDFNHDGVADIALSGNDTDNDGLDDAFEGSDNNDGFIPNDEIIDPLLELPNTDGEDDVDFRDIDDDNDGIDTIEEDDNEDGDPTNDDCDEDLTPNYLDVTPCDIVPSGFSPNGDGKNDLLVIPALSTYMDFEMQVFNRQGNKVYEYKRGGALSPEWWDGRSTGNLNLGDDVLPAGTYFYLIKFNRDERAPITGWVYLNK
ncbi:gliding motility-associated C-terminal domain-containing protein [Lutimonas zeaxanthinifaciens]|uniref:T9SS type B sorting domain-containing protein n=1 Tax=Lutimonas zeaxanthinifaciens TaxID=3060215 RepID=UPI00265D4BF9|nr:gliding motility-associated C-terminal domain-containing protein [Lutimonas sp. YSD2104]WKK65806.1 gliding motility-associated C-terminal domain-containing protein [Lutimonas sp. YSD2104]